jgi:hypothetical protein
MGPTGIRTRYRERHTRIEEPEGSASAVSGVTTGASGNALPGEPVVVGGRAFLCFVVCLFTLADPAGVPLFLA